MFDRVKFHRQQSNIVHEAKRISLFGFFIVKIADLSHKLHIKNDHFVGNFTTFSQNVC